QVPGLVEIWGDYHTYGSTLSLEYANQVYASTPTAPKLMLGLGHGATVTATSDGAAKTEYITLTYSASDGQWHAAWSVTGSMGAYSCNQTGWSSSGGEFTLNFTQWVSPQDGDFLDFVTIAAAGDANAQKKLLIGMSSGLG